MSPLPGFAPPDLYTASTVPDSVPLVYTVNVDPLIFTHILHGLTDFVPSSSRQSLHFPLILHSRLTPHRLPFRRPKPRQRLELAIPQLDVGRPDHARLQAQRAAHILVHLGRGVVAHHEVVAVGVLHLVHGDGLGQGEDAPVGEAADDAAIAQDEGADGLGDSAETTSEVMTGRKAGARRGLVVVVDVLFHLGEVARSDLYDSLARQCF